MASSSDEVSVLPMIPNSRNIAPTSRVSVKYSGQRSSKMACLDSPFAARRRAISSSAPEISKLSLSGLILRIASDYTNAQTKRRETCL